MRFIRKYGKNVARLVSTAMDNAAVYRRARAPKKGPLGVVWDINKTCNSRCLYCDYWRSDHKTVGGGSELPTAKKMEIVRKLGAAGVWQLSFCKGEPLLSDDVGLLVREAKKEKMLVNVSTNGFLLEQWAERLVDAGLDYLTVSVNSHDPAMHDRWQGVSGHFANIQRGIEKVRRLRKGRSPWVTVRCLIHQGNAFSLRDFVDYWHPRSDDIVFKPMVDKPPVFFKVPEGLGLVPADESRFTDGYLRLLDDFPGIDHRYHREIPRALFGRGGAGTGCRCFAGTFFANLDADGNLSPCIELNRPWGNLLEGDFMDIWSSGPAARFRSAFKTDVKCPDCWTDRFLNNCHIHELMSWGDRP